MSNRIQERMSGRVSKNISSFCELVVDSFCSYNIIPVLFHSRDALDVKVKSLTILRNRS
jgi:hypothetical protein